MDFMMKRDAIRHRVMEYSLYSLPGLPYIPVPFDRLLRQTVKK